MREIKFRAWITGWPKFNGEDRMLDVQTIWYLDLDNISIEIDDSVCDSDFKLMQFVTKATNGDSVYEGDIILLPADQLCKIEWRDTGFVAIAINPPDGYPREYVYWSAKEVVGNIYQNKELL